MDRQRFLRLLDELLELDEGTLQGDERLESLGNWDSLTNIGFIALADEEFNKIISPAKLEEAKTVNELLVLVDL